MYEKKIICYVLFPCLQPFKNEPSQNDTNCNACWENIVLKVIPKPLQSLSLNIMYFVSTEVAVVILIIALSLRTMDFVDEMWTKCIFAVILSAFWFISCESNFCFKNKNFVRTLWIIRLPYSIFTHAPMCLYQMNDGTNILLLAMYLWKLK